MYQWRDPDTGTTQLSGKPPAWYRTGEKGPRVIVIENGRVIDDTSRPVPSLKRKALRQQAIMDVNEDIRDAREQAVRAEQVKGVLGTPDRNQPEQETPVTLDDDIERSQETQDVTGNDPEADRKREMMRALIREELDRLESNDDWTPDE